MSRLARILLPCLLLAWLPLVGGEGEEAPDRLSWKNPASLPEDAVATQAVVFKGKITVPVGNGLCYLETRTSADSKEVEAWLAEKPGDRVVHREVVKVDGGQEMRVWKQAPDVELPPILRLVPDGETLLLVTDEGIRRLVFKKDSRAFKKLEPLETITDDGAAPLTLAGGAIDVRFPNKVIEDGKVIEKDEEEGKETHVTGTITDVVLAGGVLHVLVNETTHLLLTSKDVGEGEEKKKSHAWKLATLPVGWTDGTLAVQGSNLLAIGAELSPQDGKITVDRYVVLSEEPTVCRREPSWDPVAQHHELRSGLSQFAAKIEVSPFVARPKHRLEPIVIDRRTKHPHSLQREYGVVRWGVVHQILAQCALVTIRRNQRDSTQRPSLEQQRRQAERDRRQSGEPFGAWPACSHRLHRACR